MRPILLFVLLVSLALVACSDDDDDPTATPSESPTATAGRPGGSPPADTPTPEGSPTEPPEVTVSEPLIEGLPFVEFEHAFLSEDYPAGTAIPDVAGVFFVDTATGSIERVAARLPGDPGFFGGEVTPDNRFITGGGAEVPAGSNDFYNILIDRQAERVYGWQQNDASFLGASEDGVLFALGRFNDASRELVLLDLAFMVSRVLVPDLALGNSSRMIGRDHVLIMQNASPDFGSRDRLIVVDLRDGSLHEFSAWPDVAGFELENAYLFDASWGGGRAAVAGSYGVPDDFSTYFTILRVVDIEGDEVTQFDLSEFPGFAFGHVSPDGSLVAIQLNLRDVPPEQLGGGETWSVIAIADAATGEVLFRVRDVRLLTGDSVFSNQWLADSSGIIVAGVGEEGGPYSRRWYLVDRDGTAVTPVAPDPDGPQAGVMPAPDDLSLVALGPNAFGALDGSSTTVVPLPENDPYATHVSPWGATSDVLRFGRYHGGHDGGFGAYTILPPAIEFPPFEDRVIFAVAAGDECLNIRTEPVITFGNGESFEGDVVDCLESGTVVEVVDRPAGNFPEYIGPESTVGDFENNRLWIYVRAESGAEGWAASDFLAPPPLD